MTNSKEISTVEAKGEIKAKEEAATTPKAPRKSTSAKSKRVKIKLYRDNELYKDDVFVAVNGESYLIKRGVQVEVPQAVAEVLANADHQNQKANELVESLKAN